ncbi:actin-like ATPase domain-containing protein [Basidiobolus meristosporus CBS 931.73]|uniref:Actin-like ATPase domain-containing protein n=1 Tax=Basidiobolus meristosporus CBS 931.73 TaxID=1314790 RepID=A0A1Y1Y7T2_9FUNG|nr:actin-like ATPase domain-containing protein [Basidiobolus meristosporus CBS 931.73]|eukprot:ORX94082.1 actin-like ATPase domain-containing protein [Basidiobolus meristosporus CBS 931.73]
MVSSGSATPIYTLEERTYPGPLSPAKDYRERFFSSNTPIVIDNGSSFCRAGWASETTPRLNFENVIGKYRDRKSAAGNVMVVGNDVNHDPMAKSNARSAFDNGIVYNTDTMEHILDYTFVQLGIDTERIFHPILMTEVPCIPHYNRKIMTELLFEAYSVPSVAYGIDSLFSYYGNGHSFDDGGLIISSGNTASHVIPVVGGRGVLEHTKRINYGGVGATDYMLKLMQLKYPTFPSKMSHTQAQQLVHDHTYFSQDYLQELRQFEDPQYLNQHDHVIQFPFTPPVVEEKTEEEQARIAAKRKEQAKRLQEQAAKTRLAKLIEKEENLKVYKNLKETKRSMHKSEFLDKLEDLGFEEESELDEAIKKTETAIRRARNKELGIVEEEEKEKPNFSLVDVPDEQLSEADRKEKRKQKLLKAGYEARERARIAKEEEKARQEEEMKRDEERRLENPEKWLEELHGKRTNLLEKIRSRQRRKEQLSDRRSHASQLRMKSIANLVGESNVTPRRRKRGDTDDTFGADDDDWAVYRQIFLQSKEDDSEAEEEDAALLEQYEATLLKYDENFLPDDVLEAQNSWQTSTLHRFYYGFQPLEADDMAQQYQLHLNVERIRVPEVLFQPTIIGLDQAGLVETINDTLHRFNADQRSNMVKSIFLTGGYTLTPNLSLRLHSSMKAILPAGTPINIHCAQDPLLDAWKGASKWASQSTEEFNRVSVTQKEYEEMGGDYIKEHRMGNVFRNLNCF